MHSVLCSICLDFTSWCGVVKGQMETNPVGRSLVVLIMELSLSGVLPRWPGNDHYSVCIYWCVFSVSSLHTHTHTHTHAHTHSSSSDALLHQTSQHVGAVRTLDVNPFQANLLVSGAGESELFIWDLNNLTTPMSPGNKIHPLEDISGVAWNRQVIYTS